VPGASQLFSESDRRRINESVQAGESRTSAEIVPVVATSSGRYDRAEDLAGLWLGILLMIAVAVFWRAPQADEGSWSSTSPVWFLVRLVVAMVGGFIAGAVICSRVTWMRRLFTPRIQMTDEVNQAARTVFFDNRVHHTQHGGGVLIYVSLFEHVAVVLADRHVIASVGQAAIDELCQSLTRQLRLVGPTEALCQSIDAVATRLSAAMPRGSEDANQLPDALVTIG
jgi:putative membrane protein